MLATLVSLVALSAPASALASGNPVVTGSLSDPAQLSGATSVAVSGTIAYTTDYAGGQVTAVDISNPASPTVLGSSATATYLQNASTINISGGFAYVVSKNRNGPKISGGGTNDDGTGNSLTILDIHTNPNVPTIVGHFTDAVNMFGAYGIAVSGTDAFVAAQGCLAGQPCPNALVGNSVTVLDVSTPGTPTLVTTLHNPTSGQFVNALDHADSVAISGTLAFVTASYSNRLTVIDISNPASPTIVASFADPAINFPVDVTVQGSFAYVVNQLSTPPNFTVVDISTPASPKVVGGVTNGFLNGAYRIRLHGNFAYVSGSSAHSIGVIDISNPTNPTLVAGLSDVSHFNNTTGLDVDATGHLIVTSPFLPAESFSLYPPFPSPTGPTFATGTVSDVTLDPSPIAVRISGSSEPAPITGQTAANFTFTTNDSVATMLCQLDGGTMSPCTSTSIAAGTQQYSGLAAGALHTFVVQATDAAGNIASASYQWQINAGGSANTSAPTISGSTVQGQVLTAAGGSWSGTPAPALTYIWQRCTAGVCNAISGATAATYTLTAADLGATIDVVVTGTNNLGVDHATSAQTGVVTAPPPPPPPPPPPAPVTVSPANSALPTISGSPVVAKTLTASPGTWSGTPAPTFTYQWRRCNGTGASCVAIAGATSSTYAPVSGDVGSRLTVLVTATNSAASASASANPTAAVTGIGSSATTGPVKITKLALAKSHGHYTLQVSLSGAATVTVTLKRVHPHKATLKHAKHKVGAGTNKITLQVPKAHHVTYTVVVTVVRSGAGAANTTSRSVTFSVK